MFIVNFFEYILVMLLAGAGGFGGGIGGINIMKEYALSWVAEPEMAGAAMTEILSITSFAQIGGYAQGMMLATYLGTYTPLGIFGGILGAVIFTAPSVLIIAVALKIGGKLYKNSAFQYSVKYINIFAAGLICMIMWHYIITVFSADPIIYVAVAGLACFFHLYFRISPALLIIAGGIIGAVVQRMD
jgi:chromate transport protein ChrA